MATNFWTKIDYNSAIVENNCALFLLTPPFSGPGSPMVPFKFFPADSHCYGNEFWDKIDYNSAPPRCFHPIFGPGLCNGVMQISPLKTPVIMATNRFYSKTKLAAGSQERQMLKRSC